MTELKNTCPELELRGTGELIFNTFTFVQFIFLIILHSAEDFFSNHSPCFSAVIFISLPTF